MGGVFDDRLWLLHHQNFYAHFSDFSSILDFSIDFVPRPNLTLPYTQFSWQRSNYQIKATPQSGVLYDNETELEWQGTVNCQSKLIYSNQSEYLENLLNDSRNQQ